MKKTYDCTDYEATHGAKPRGHGSWMFEVSVSRGDGSWQTTEHYYQGSFSEAKVSVAAAACQGLCGIKEVYVEVKP